MSSGSASPKALTVTAAAVALFGLAVALWTLVGSAPDIHRMQRKARDIERIQAMRAPHDRMVSWTEGLAARGGGSPRPLREQLRERSPQGTFELLEEEPESVGGRLRVRRADVAWPSIPAAELGGALEALQSAHPPWRLVACSLTAGPEPGYLRATISIESVELSRE